MKAKETTRKGQEKIDITDQEQIQRWCSELQCNEMRLKNAIRAVGPTADAVRKYMLKNF
jgi:hypothetical protein